MNNHKNNFTFHFIFRYTESISIFESEMTRSFAHVHKDDSFVCIGYIFKTDFERVFTLKTCMPEIKLLQEPDYYKDLSVKSTSGSSKVTSIGGTKNFLVIFVSIKT